ncbi:MAG TPA: M28 family peptidase [Gaiellaceae bacterium]|nr:M28 family peptidase [Gaiellaceae bacterium]
MAALRPPPTPRRPRPGSLERPVNGRTYRGTALLVAIPLLIAAFTVARPDGLPPSSLPPTFDQQAAVDAARELALQFPGRPPGTAAARDAADWVAQRFRAYGFTVQRDGFEASIPGRGTVPLQNIYAVAPGRSGEALVVMAHRDNVGTGPGANDNASGTGALLELARGYGLRGALPSGRAAGPLSPAHTIVFLSTDGGAFGGLGAVRFLDRSPYRRRLEAVLNLAAVGGRRGLRLELAGDRPRSPDPTLVETAANRIRQRTGGEPRRTSAVGQLIDLAFPFGFYEQAPFVGRGVPAVTLTTAGERPPRPVTDTLEDLVPRRIGQAGGAVEGILGSLDEGVALTGSTATYVYLGPRLIRGWAIKLVLVAALLPFLLAAVDLFARCRRRRIPLAPAFRSYRSRAAFWLWTGVIFGVLALLGAWGEGVARPPSPDADFARDRPLAALATFAALALAGWFVARERLLPRRPVSAEEELAGHVAALLALAVVALLTVATNPFALIFVLPSLHAWLWLPQVRYRPPWIRACVLCAGLAGPVLLLGSFAWRFELGADAPWYVAQLVALGYVPLPTVAIGLAWLAAAGQLAAVATGRYAPYPSARERPPRGPVRELIRRLLLLIVSRRQQQLKRAAGS